jgi:energy-coupling factor transport system permease protein
VAGRHLGAQAHPPVTARALAVWSASALTVALATDNPVYRALVMLAAVNVLVALRRPGARTRSLARALMVAMLMAIALTVVLSHSGAHPFATLPAGLPIAGGHLTWEAVAFGATSGAGICAAVLAVASLTLVVDAPDLIDALPRALSRSGAAVATALNLVPGLGRSAVEIREAQRMRGGRSGRVRDWPDIAVPVVLTAVENSVALAEAMEARGYGAGPRTHFSPAVWRGADVFVTGVSVLAAACFIALRVSGGAAGWYPFPTLSLPPVEAPAVICCVALALPAVARRPA